jgi:hypothetical protein
MCLEAIGSDLKRHFPGIYLEGLRKPTKKEVRILVTWPIFEPRISPV